MRFACCFIRTIMPVSYINHLIHCWRRTATLSPYRFICNIIQRTSSPLLFHLLHEKPTKLLYLVYYLKDNNDDWLQDKLYTSISYSIGFQFQASYFHILLPTVRRINVINVIGSLYKMCQSAVVYVYFGMSTRRTSTGIICTITAKLNTIMKIWTGISTFLPLQEDMCLFHRKNNSTFLLYVQTISR